MYTQLLSILKRRPTLYEKSSAAFWDDPHVSPGMLEAHLDPQVQGATREHAFVDRSALWIHTLLPPERYPKLLDLGCGPGLYTQRFCAYGYEATGLDISRGSIEYAKKYAREKHLPIRYRLEDYLNLNEVETYDVITLIYCGYGELPPEDRQRLLKNVYRALKKDGHFLFDVFTSREYRNRQENTTIQYVQKGYWRDEPHALIHSFFRYDDEGTYADRYIVLTESALHCYHLYKHAFSATELTNELSEANFDVVGHYANVAGDTYSPKSRVMCTLAKKG